MDPWSAPIGHTGAHRIIPIAWEERRIVWQERMPIDEITDGKPMVRQCIHKSTELTREVNHRFWEGRAKYLMNDGGSAGVARVIDQPGQDAVQQLVFTQLRKIAEHIR